MWGNKPITGTGALKLHTGNPVTLLEIPYGENMERSHTEKNMLGAQWGEGWAPGSPPVGIFPYLDWAYHSRMAVPRGSIPKSIFQKDKTHCANAHQTSPHTTWPSPESGWASQSESQEEWFIEAWRGGSSSTIKVTLTPQWFSYNNSSSYTPKICPL